MPFDSAVKNGKTGAQCFRSFDSGLNHMEKQLYTITVRSRNIGKTAEMILSLIEQLSDCGECHVAGCKNPDDIANRLKDKGHNVRYKEMTYIKQRAIYDEYGIIGYYEPETVKTGYLFYIQDYSPKPTI